MDEQTEDTFITDDCNNYVIVQKISKQDHDYARLQIYIDGLPGNWIDYDASQLDSFIDLLHKHGNSMGY